MSTLGALGLVLRRGRIIPAGLRSHLWVSSHWPAYAGLLPSAPRSCSFMLRTHVPDGLSWQVFETCLSILWCVPGSPSPCVGWVTGYDLIPAACGPSLPGSINQSPSSESRPPGPCDKAQRGQLCTETQPVGPALQGFFFFLLFLLHWLFLRFPFSRDGDKSTIPLGLFSLPAPFLYLMFVKTFLHLGYETEHSWECCQSRNIAISSKRVNFLFSNLGEEVNWWDGEMGGKGGIVFWLRVCQDSKPGTVTS